ncbi:GIY-YIG nuclease family protein [Salipaludibacillus agaradhaerens]|uniref:GIY-YIG nuclease family protein n=1 Tax=Salipaludibacillus agaradhaerens TaxID=76935 RepID=UPI002151B461|nr:GIY-YIG nuclease family protein [Salipaludibacillus agaradhaerens]MCR6107398.1 GIY-YIG nuclease family protein [Salipaludibacillus agaradhaerens]MCR6119427.1 GIY-YIG nuclease family protein [Salipaludibacillus agaradhaerens]UJW58456.1 GIY-YIG nuclease family protein [Bacillus sp. A116_S68]
MTIGMIDDNHQLYVLNLKLSHNTHILIGKREVYFSEGFYVYIGSAIRNIRKRVERHYKLEKRKHWHIDYIREYAKWINAYTFPFGEGECALKALIQKATDGTVEVNKIGSSDCGCDSHFLKVTSPFQPCLLNVQPFTNS